MSDLDNRNAREIGVNTGRIAPQQYAAEGGVGLLKGLTWTSLEPGTSREGAAAPCRKTLLILNSGWSCSV